MPKKPPGQVFNNNFNIPVSEYLINNWALIFILSSATMNAQKTPLVLLAHHDVLP